MSDISDALEAAAQAPAKVSIDGQSAEAKSVDEQIKADQYGKARTSRARNHLGLTFRQFEPGGCG